MFNAIMGIMKVAYRTILRGLLKAAIDDPDQEWDEFALKIVDSIFDYHQPE